MKVSLFILVFASLLASHVVVAAEPVFGTSAESKYLRAIKPPKGKAVVYIYQRREDGSGASPMIWLNNYQIGRLVPGSFTIWQLSPGQLNLRVEGTDSAGFSLVSEAGKVYLFRVVMTQTVTGPMPQLMRMPESYRADLAATQLLKNPGVVTAAAVLAPAKPAEQPAQTATEKSVTQPSSPSSAGVTPGGIGLMLKLGSMTLAEDTQTIYGTDRNYDDKVSGLYAIEAYYQFVSGFTMGGELLSYSTTFTTVGFNDTHDVDVDILLANAKQYFRAYSSLQPYLGAGVGLAATDVSGPSVQGNTSGLAYQLLAGVEYRGKTVGGFGEFKYLSADTESDDNQSIDVSGTVLLAGIALHF